MPRVFLVTVALLCGAGELPGQRLTSAGLATGVAFGEAIEPTAAFSASATLHAGITWLIVAQRSVADIQQETMVATRRDVSIAVLPMWQPLGARIFLTGGVSITNQKIARIGEDDVDRTRLGALAMGGVRLPLAGDGLLAEFTGRADHHAATMFSALFGVRWRLGVATSLARGEPQHQKAERAHAAVWNEVLMQLILLQQNLESFARIKEIESGIELELEAGRLTIWDDVAKIARVLAAADPPVVITAFGPNAGRVAAAITAGSFPAERVRLERADRVFLRVER